MNGKETLATGVIKSQGIFEGYIAAYAGTKLIWREYSQILRNTEFDAQKDATKMLFDYVETNNNQ